MRTQIVKLFDNYSMVQDGYSNPYCLELVTGYSIQASWTGTPTCYLFIQVSNDPSPSNSAPTNWSLIDRSIIPSGGVAGNNVWKQAFASFRWIRFGCAFGSSTGTLNAYLSCKGTSQ